MTLDSLNELLLSAAITTATEEKATQAYETRHYIANEQ